MKKICVFLACALLFTVAAFSFGACERKGSGLNQKIDQVLGGRFLTARVLKNFFIQISGLRKKFDEI